MDIFAGYNFSICYTVQGSILAWGDNSNYKYGTDIDLRGSYSPVFSNDILGLNVGKIFTGINNMIVILSDYPNTIQVKNRMF